MAPPPAACKRAVTKILACKRRGERPKHGAKLYFPLDSSIPSTVDEKTVKGQPSVDARMVRRRGTRNF